MDFRVSVWTDYYSDLSLSEALDRFASVGYCYTELSLIHLDKLMSQDGTPEMIGMRAGKMAADKGFKIPQAHLSFAKGICDPTAIDDLKKELDLFLGLGVENAIIHAAGGKGLDPVAKFERRVESLSILSDYIKGSPIKLCLENLGSVPETHTVERIRKFIDAVGSDRLGICLDTGHLHLVNCRGEAVQSQSEFIHGAGKDLCAMHITNNSGGGDDHLMPYSSRTGVDWVEVVKALREINYRGLFNLEILGENKAPMYIRDEKLKYIKKMTDYMISEEFIAE